MFTPHSCVPARLCGPEYPQLDTILSSDLDTLQRLTDFPHYSGIVPDPSAISLRISQEEFWSDTSSECSVDARLSKARSLDAPVMVENMMDFSGKSRVQSHSSEASNQQCLFLQQVDFQTALDSVWKPEMGSFFLQGHPPPKEPGLGLSNPSDTSKTSTMKSNPQPETLAEGFCSPRIVKTQVEERKTESSTSVAPETFHSSSLETEESVFLGEKKRRQRYRTIKPTVAAPQRRHTCPKCGHPFTRAFNLKQHLPTHEAASIRRLPFQCPQTSCRRGFSRKNDLHRHIAAIHRP